MNYREAYEIYQRFPRAFRLCYTCPGMIGRVQLRYPDQPMEAPDNADYQVLPVWSAGNSTFPREARGDTPEEVLTEGWLYIGTLPRRHIRRHIRGPVRTYQEGYWCERTFDQVGGAVDGLHYFIRHDSLEAQEFYEVLYAEPEGLPESEIGRVETVRYVEPPAAPDMPELTPELAESVLTVVTEYLLDYYELDDYRMYLNNGIGLRIDRR